jgi:hypothetical protein
MVRMKGRALPGGHQPINNQNQRTSGVQMKNTKNKSSFLTRGATLALLAASLAAPVAEAGWVQSGNTYTYTAANYSVLADSANVTGSYTNSEFMTWSMTLAAPLAPGIAFGLTDLLTTLSWTFDDGRASGNGTFDSSTGWSGIFLGTDASGSITDWIAGFVGPRSTGSSAMGFSCGGLGCEPQNQYFNEIAPETGYSVLFSDSFADNFQPAWDDLWSNAENNGQVLSGPFIYGYLAKNDPAVSSADFAQYYGSGGSVPEPGALALVCAGLMGTFAARRRAQRQS